MHIACFNPQANFDPLDSYWTEHPDFGGQLVYVKELALAWGQKGHKVDIITRQIVDADWPEFARAMDSYPGHENVRILRVPCGPRHFLRKEDLWPHLAEWIENIIQFYQCEDRLPDIGTAHYGDGGIAAVLFQKQTKIPFTFTGHSLGAQKMDKTSVKLKIKNSKLQRKEFDKMVEHFHFDKRISAERTAMAWASRIVTSTRQERYEQYSHPLYERAVDPSDDGKFAVIPPGVNLAIFGKDNRTEADVPIKEKIEAMIKRDIPEQRRCLPFVICSSRLDRKKNHLGLIKAWVINKELRESANLMIILKGSSEPLLKREEIFTGEELSIVDEIVDVIEKNDIWDCVTAFDLSSQHELAACYRYLACEKQGVFCLVAQYEPFGLAPLEAMAAGLPVVVTKNGGPSESLQDGKREYGILVNPDEPNEVADGLLSLVIDKEKWHSFQQAGLRRVHDKYTWEKTADGYLDEISSILPSVADSLPSYPIPSYFVSGGSEELDSYWLRERYLSTMN